MPKIEKDCHAFVLNAERRNNLNAMNKDQNNQNANRNNNPNANRGPSNQNRSYSNQGNQGNRNYNNPNQSHHNRPYHGNQNPNYRYNNRNPSAGHGGSHRNDYHGHGDHSHNTSSDKSQKQNPYPIIPTTIPAEKSQLSSSLTSLFKNENVSANQASTKETKPDTSKARDQNKPPVQNPSDKAKRADNDIFGFEDTDNKRKTGHDISEFDQIAKKRQVDPIGQNS